MKDNVIGLTETGKVVEGELLRIQGMDFIYNSKTNRVVKLREYTVKQQTPAKLEDEYLFVGDTIGNERFKGEVAMFMTGVYVNVLNNNCMESYPLNDFIQQFKEDERIEVLERAYEDWYGKNK